MATPDSGPGTDDAPDARLLAALGPEVLRLLDRLTGTMFCAKDVAGRYVAVNQAFADRTRERSVRAVVGRTARELFDAGLAEHYEAQDARVLATGEPLQHELELVLRPDGTPGWYVTSKEPVRHHGEVVGLVSVSEDLRSDPADVAVASLSRVVALVHERLADPPSVAEMAAVAGCSPATLDRRMRRVLHLPPHRYVLRERLDRAAVLLTTTDLPIARVAAEVGFSDQAVLTRTFGRHTGRTPLQFRRASREAAGTAARRVGRPDGPPQEEGPA